MQLVFVYFCLSLYIFSGANLKLYFCAYGIRIFLLIFVYLCIFAGANLKLNEERRMPEEITDEKPINLRLESILSNLASAS